MKAYKKLAALLTAAVMLTSAAALADVCKDEIVYAKLGADGTPGEVVIVNAFESGEAATVTDHGAYEAVENLSGANGLTSAQGENTFTMDKGRAYYRGTLGGAALPWSIHIAYTLDGQAVTTEQLAGASGELGLSIGVTKNTACAVPFYDRYMMQITVTLSAERYLNVRAEGASVSVSGGDLLVTFALLPGKEGQFSLTADASDIALDAITFAGVPMGFDLSGIDLSQITSQLDPLFTGVASLKDGTKQVSDGLKDADAGFTAWQKGFAEFSTGLESYLTGANAAAGGAGQLKASAAQLNEGLSPLLDGLSAVPAYQQSAAQLKAGWDAFYAGLTQALDGTAALGEPAASLKTALDGLKTGAESIGQGLGALSSGAIQVSGGAEQMAQGIQGVDMTKAASDALTDMTGGTYAPESFVSNQNTGLRAVQFVLMTDALRASAPETAEAEAPQKGLWDRILDLFR